MYHPRTPCGEVENAFLQYLAGELQRLANAAAFPIMDKGNDGLLVVTTVMADIDLQGFLLGLLRGIADIALPRLLDTKNIAFRAALDEDFLEGTATLLVVEAVNGENLLAVDVRQGKGGLDVIKLVLELALVEEHEDVGVVDDGLLDNLTAGDVLDLLRHHTDHRPVLTGGLIEVLDIFCHDGGGNGLPCLLDDQTLTPFLDTHLLGEHVHDDEHDDGEKDGVVLHLVNLEDDELFIEKGAVHVVVQGVLQLTALVERLQDGGEVMDGEVHMLLLQYLGDALHGELIIGVETQLTDTELAALHLHFDDVTADLVIEAAGGKLGELHQLMVHLVTAHPGGVLFSLSSGIVIDKVVKLTLLVHQPVLTLLFLLGETDTMLLHIGFLEVLLKGVEGAVLLVLEDETVSQLLTLGVAVATERSEILPVVLYDGLVDDGLLNLRGLLGALEDKEDKALQEVLLLSEVLGVLLLRDLEGVHGDGTLLAVADIDTAEIAADTLIAVACIDDDDIGVLLVILADNGIHKETFSAAARTQHEEITVIGVFLLALLAGDVNGHGHALTVGIVATQGGDVTLRLTLLVHQADGGLTEREETVVLRAERKAVTGEAGDEKLQLVVRPAADTDILFGEDILQMVGDLVHVLVGTDADKHVEMGIDKLTVLTGHDLLRLLDVLGGNHIGGVGHGTVLVLLLLQVVLLLLLVGDEQNLVVDKSVHIGHMVDVAHEIGGHGGVIDMKLGIGTEDIGESYAVEVYQTEDLALPVTHTDSFAVNLEVGHGKDLVVEVDGEETVGILTGFLHTEEGTGDAAVGKQRIDFLDLHMEVTPFLTLESEETSLLALLGDDKIGAAGRIGTALEETEIGLGEETLAVVHRLIDGSFESPVYEDVLLVQAITLAKRGDNGGHQVHEAIVAVLVSGELQDGIIHLNDGGILSRLGIDDADAINILDAEIDVLEDTGTLAASAEGLDGDTHADENGNENQYANQ